MTVKAHINAGLAGGDRSASLDAHAARLYERPTAVMAVVELAPVDRIVPVSEDSKKDPIIRLRIESLEVAAAGGPEETLRELSRALWVARTADGTLNGEDEVKLAEQTIEHAAGILSGNELARLRVVLDWTIELVRNVLESPNLREVDLRRLLVESLDRAAAARDTGVQLDLVAGAAT